MKMKSSADILTQWILFQTSGWCDTIDTVRFEIVASVSEKPRERILKTKMI